MTYVQNGLLHADTGALVLNGLGDGVPTFPANTNIIDNFNRADGGVENAGAQWSADSINAADGQPLTIASNLVMASSQLAGITSGSYGPNVDAQVDIVTAGTNDMAIFARIQGGGTSDWSAYWVIVLDDGTWTLRKRVGGTASTVGTSVASTALQAGQKLGFRVNGSTVSAYRFASGTWTLVVTGTDTDITLAGKLGLEFDNNDWRGDNFAGGNV